MIKLTILGEPSAQPRHRHFQIKGHVQTYDPAKSKKGTFASVISDQAPADPIDDPIMLEMNFYMSRPKNHYGSGKNSKTLKGSAPEWHTGRPDLDNLTKFVQDALNKVFWRDDSLICQINCRKLYSDRPRTEITIITLI